jgi:hypothetical protein
LPQTFHGLQAGYQPRRHISQKGEDITGIEIRPETLHRFFYKLFSLGDKFIICRVYAEAEERSREDSPGVAQEVSVEVLRCMREVTKREGSFLAHESLVFCVDGDRHGGMNQLPFSSPSIFLTD